MLIPIKLPLKDMAFISGEAQFQKGDVVRVRTQQLGFEVWIEADFVGFEDGYPVVQDVQGSRRKLFSMKDIMHVRGN